MAATTNFRVAEHTISTSYIREYPRATAENQEVELKLALKQYVPLRQAFGENQITVISAPGNGFPKEIYEPLWDDLYDRLASRGVCISSIWIADYSNQGDSGVLNETEMGNDPSWMDYARDLFLMINQFRKQMRRPLVGIAHSMGGSTLLNLALMHPRLFTTLVIIDPALVPELQSPDFVPAKTSVNRRDQWPNREAAESAFKRSRYSKCWDSRVIDRWLRYGYREVSTNDKRTGNPRSGQITLKTARDQEVATAMRFNFDPMDPNPDTHPDADLAAHSGAPFYRPELRIIHSSLPHVRPSVFYIFGADSHLSTPERQAEKVNATGTGIGGSGGIAKGRVRSHSLQGVGHLVPMERVAETADLCSSWLVPEIGRWKGQERTESEAWNSVPRHKRNQVTEEFRRTMDGWDLGVKKGGANGRKPRI